MGPHPDADDRDLGDVGVDDKVVILDLTGRHRVFHRLLGAGDLIDGAGKGHVGDGAGMGLVIVLFRDVLNDHVDVHARIRQRPEDGAGDAGPVLDGEERDLCLVARIGDARDDFRFHDFILVADQGPGVFVGILE